MTLHRVVYHRLDSDVVADYSRTLKDYCVNQWLISECRGQYYHSPPYLFEKFIEFENESDAVMFALKWS